MVILLKKLEVVVYKIGHKEQIIGHKVQLEVLIPNIMRGGGPIVVVKLNSNKVMCGYLTSTKW